MWIETERLLLRPLRSEDISQLVELWADADVTCYLDGPRNQDDVRQALEDELLEQPPGEYELWPVVEKSTGAVVGHCGLLEKDVQGNREVELVYVFSSRAWSSGYATEIGRSLGRFAFSQLGLERIVSLIEPGNAASKHVALKLGMHEEGTIQRPGNRVLELYVLDRDGT